GTMQGPTGVRAVLFPSTFDNATKLLNVKSQKFVGVVTYGVGAIGLQAPRTANSFLPEFDEELTKEAAEGDGRLSVEVFAAKLGAFFLRQWTDAGMPNPAPNNEEMFFIVGGYDEKAAYGRVFELSVPGSPNPVERMEDGNFGALYGGQREITDRLLQGFDSRIPDLAQELLGIPAKARKTDLADQLKKRLTVAIPWQLLPLQDCVDLSIFVVRSTILLQQWLVGIRGVGGAVDVATITRTRGFKETQVKQVTGDKESMRRHRED
ncbi:MAG: hypothetical protein ABR991_05425, partial [Terracidiphilus sp.]